MTIGAAPKKRAAWALGLATAAAASMLIVPEATAQQRLGVTQTMMLCVRVLAYDQAAKSRGHPHVAVVYPDANSRARTEARRMQRALRRLDPSGSMRVSIIAYRDSGDLRVRLRRQKVTTMHLTTGLSSHIDAIVGVANRLRVPTLTGVVGYLSRGVAVALVQVRGRPRVVVQLPASRRQGMRLHGSLLRIATVLR